MLDINYFSKCIITKPDPCTSCLVCWSALDKKGSIFIKKGAGIEFALVQNIGTECLTFFT